VFPISKIGIQIFQTPSSEPKYSWYELKMAIASVDVTVQSTLYDGKNSETISQLI